MQTLQIQTHRKDEILDMTDRVQQFLGNEERQSGICVVFAAHTTCALTTADLDPGTDLDFLQALRGVLPEMRYRHPHDPAHTPDHILASLLGPSVAVPFQQGQLALGTWQRIILVELDGPRSRTIHLSAMG